MSSFSSLSSILSTFNPVEDKYISREFQAYGVHLAEELNDMKHTALYIKFAKTIPRPVLEKAFTFVKDANAKNRGALFMWKLKDLGAWPGKAPKKKKQSVVVEQPQLTDA